MNPERLIRLLWWLPTLLYVAAILFMTTRPSLPLPARHLDTGVHFLVYAVLALSVQVSMRRSSVRRPVEPIQSELEASLNNATSRSPDLRDDRGMILAAVLTIAVGALDETLQIFSPYRTASFLDFLADTAGALAGTMLMGAVCRRQGAGRGS